MVANLSLQLDTLATYLQTSLHAVDFISIFVTPLRTVANTKRIC